MSAAPEEGEGGGEQVSQLSRDVHSEYGGEIGQNPWQTEVVEEKGYQQAGGGFEGADNVEEGKEQVEDEVVSEHRKHSPFCI